MYARLVLHFAMLLLVFVQTAPAAAQEVGYECTVRSESGEEWPLILRYDPTEPIDLLAVEENTESADPLFPVYSGRVMFREEDFNFLVTRKGGANRILCGFFVEEGYLTGLRIDIWSGGLTLYDQRRNVLFSGECQAE